MAKTQPELIRSALGHYTLDDLAWGELAPFMPPRTGKKVTDWRFLCAVWCVRFAAFQRGVVWARLPHASAARAAMMRASAFGTFDRIAAALPRLKHMRHAAWELVIAGARRAAARRGRK